MVYDANAKINEILNHSDSLNFGEKLHWTQQFFLHDYKEIYPKSSANIIGRHEVTTVDEIKYKIDSYKYLLAALGAGFLVICIIVACYRRKK